jgi:hypothetical protein
MNLPAPAPPTAEPSELTPQERAAGLAFAALVPDGFRGALLMREVPSLPREKAARVARLIYDVLSERRIAASILILPEGCTVEMATEELLEAVLTDISTERQVAAAVCEAARIAPGRKH